MHRGPNVQNHPLQGPDPLFGVFLPRCFFTICLLCIMGCGGCGGTEDKKAEDKKTEDKQDGPAKVLRTPNEIMKEMGLLPNPYMKAGGTEQITKEGNQGDCFYDQQANSLYWRIWTCNNPACSSRGKVTFTKENPDVKVVEGQIVWPDTITSTRPPTKCPSCGSTNLTEYFTPPVAQRKQELEQELKDARWARAQKKNK